MNCTDYFASACGHYHHTARDAALCPNRGWDTEHRRPYDVVYVTHSSTGLAITTTMRLPREWTTT